MKDIVLLANSNQLSYKYGSCAVMQISFTEV